MDVEQPVASLSPTAEGAPTLGVYANGGLVETPAGGVVDDAPEDPVSEASAATEEEPPATTKPKATVSPDAKSLKKIGSSPPKGSTTTKPSSSAGARSVKKAGIILYLHHPHFDFSLNLPCSFHVLGHQFRHQLTHVCLVSDPELWYIWCQQDAYCAYDESRETHYFYSS